MKLRMVTLGLLTVFALFQLTGCTKKEEEVTPSTGTTSPSATGKSAKPGGNKAMQGPDVQENPGATEPAFGAKAPK